MGTGRGFLSGWDRLMFVLCITATALLAAASTDARIPFELGGARLIVERVETVAGTLLTPLSTSPMPGKREFHSADDRVRLALEATRLSADLYEIRYTGSYFIRVSISLEASAAGYACRLRPSQHADVLVTATGPVTISDANALYVPQDDLAVELSGSAAVRGGRLFEREVLVAAMDSSRTRLLVAVRRDWLRQLRTTAERGEGWEGLVPVYDGSFRWCLSPDSARFQPQDLRQRKVPTPSRLWETFQWLSAQSFVPSLGHTTSSAKEAALGTEPWPAMRPITLYAFEGLPRFWVVHVGHGKQRYDFVLFMNWSDRLSMGKANFEDLGLEGDAYLGYLPWEDRALGPVRHGLLLNLLPFSCRAIVLLPLRDSPEALGVSGEHLPIKTAIREVLWDRDTYTLSGVLAPARDSKAGFLAVWTAGRPVLSGEVDGVSTEVTSAVSGTARLPIHGSEGVAVRWRIRFGERASNRSPEPIRGLVATPEVFSVSLTWEGGTGKTYLVRNGVLVGLMDGQEFFDLECEPDTEYEYRLFAADPLTGQLTEVSAEVRTRTQAPKDAWLDTLGYTLGRRGASPPRRGMSVSGTEISLAGQKYGRGIGVSAGADLRYRLYRRYSRLTALVGVEDASEGKGSVSFVLMGDGKVIFDSGPMRKGEDPKAIELDIYGVHDLRLVVRPADRNAAAESAAWANAQLIAR